MSAPLDVGSQLTLQLLQGIGQQIQAGRQQAQEASVLNQILPQLQQPGQDPEQLLQAILGASLHPGLSSETRKTVAGLAGPISQFTRSREINAIRQDELNRRIADAEEKKGEKLKEKTLPLKGGLRNISAMRDARANNFLGRTTSIRAPFSGDTRRDREIWLTNARKLIGLANTPGLVIRNQKEFEAITGSLLNENLSDEAAEALLDQLEETITLELNELLPKGQQMNSIGVQGIGQITLEDIRREKERRKGK